VLWSAPHLLPAADRMQFRETSRKTKNQGEPSMAALMLRATSLIETVVAKMLPRSADHRTMAGRGRVSARSEPSAARSPSPSCTLDLSKSRAYDAALEILGAYKLTGNFHVNLEIVLKDLRAFKRVTFEIEPTARLPYHPDCRHVVFRPYANVSMERFSESIRSIRERIGFDAALPWWVCSLVEVHVPAPCLVDSRHTQRSRCAICGKKFANEIG
jgi:hypothetical protein